MKSLFNENEKLIFAYRTVTNNIAKYNEDIKVSFGQNEIYQVWIKYNERPSLRVKNKGYSSENAAITDFTRVIYDMKDNHLISIIIPIHNGYEILKNVWSLTTTG